MGRTDIVVLKKEEFNGNNYRAIDCLSYSALSTYTKDIRKFYKEYILKEKKEDSDSDFMRMGNLVDVLKTDENKFDDYFVITTANKPSGQLLTFTDQLFKLKQQDANTEFAILMQKAYDFVKEDNGGKLRDKFETFVEKFNTSAIGYFTELINSYGKTIVTIEESTLAKEIVKKINICSAFKPTGQEVLSKHALFFNVGDEPFKAEIDEMWIDHKNKIIYPYDYKITSFVNDFVYNGFLKNNYWIQSGLYKFAIESMVLTEKMKGYRVENMAFKVADQSNYYDPLLYKTTDAHYQGAWNGFYIGKRYRKGISQIIADINFSKENDIWGMTAENYRNNAEIIISDFKENIEE